MKRKTLMNGLFWLLLMSITTLAYSQQSTYTKKPGYWTLGINGGFAYQQSDVPTRFDGFGLGLTLGKNLYYKQGAPFSFAARGRLLYTQTYGLDDEPSLGLRFNDALNGVDGPDYTQSGGGPGFVYQNHRTDLGELGLEGVLTFNKLRERTGAIFSIYGGLGLDLYSTSIDQLDSDGSLYTDAYNGLNPQGSRSSIRNQLKQNILDGEYETFAHGFEDGIQLGIMPSLGVELGYQLGPRFSMGIGHRVTWARTDLLDGEQWNNDNSLTGENDIHHYTSLHMRWDINPKEPTLELPQITVIDPSYNPYTSASTNYRVKARIRYVSSPMDITATVNGYPLAFDFNNEIFTSAVTLETGTNEVVITARNAAGTDSETVILTLKDLFEEEPTVELPRVRFTNPPRDDYRVENDRFDLTASVQNIRSKNEIRLFVNGRSTDDFTFNGNRGEVSARVRLEEGRNTFRISASNAAGTDQDETSIIYDAPVQVLAPRVNITRPSADPHRTDVPRATVEADIQNIDSRRQIRVQINGRASDRFDYRNGFLRTEIDLRQGRNIVLISASNEAGEDSDEISIYYDEPFTPVVDPPVVRFTNPGSYQTRTRESAQNIRAQVRNVERRADIRYIVNGRSSNSFDFDSRSQILTARVNLREGNNEVRIEARNEAGRDEASVQIVFEKQIIVNPKKLPTVRITRPADNSNSSEANIQLEAETRFVDRNQDIEIEVNGRRMSRFQFDQRRQRISAGIGLTEGTNNIRITVRNRDGRDEDQVSVTYRRVKTPPNVRITSPTNGSSTGEANTKLTADIRQVTNKADIQVELNGRRVNNFSFDSRRGTLSADLTLTEGTNNIRVTASNSDGRDQDQVN
ncbi:MAG: hypothetical protein AAFV25_23350, partial [Bacteroidota bacterium]